MTFGQAVAFFASLFNIILALSYVVKSRMNGNDGQVYFWTAYTAAWGVLLIYTLDRWL